jgi:hypothetical protein
MTKKVEKYLVDTSAVRPAMGQSTLSQQKHFAELVGDGSLWSSVYLRMEFIRRWFCSAARLAFTIEHFSDVPQAIWYLEQDFKPRENKAILAVLGTHLQQVGPLKTTRAAAEECASLAVNWLKLFDRTFPRAINNSCGCQIGGLKLEIDFNSLLRELQQFYVGFSEPITNCQVNHFLNLANPKGRCAAILTDAEAAEAQASKKLLQLQQSKAHITCKECATIGDAVIALEQPKSWCLLHTDKSFDSLCGALGRPHKLVASVRSFDKELYDKLNPKPEGP